jgi:hypothetical protein
VSVPAFGLCECCRGDAAAASGRHADHQRYRELSTGHMRIVAALLTIWSSAKG